MTFKHKLSVRLALLRNVARVATLLGLACITPPGDRLSGPNGQIKRVVIIPDSLSTPVDQEVEFVAVGVTNAGDTANVTVRWGVTDGTITEVGIRAGRAYGRYKPNKPGRHHVEVSDSGGRVDTATVDVPVPVASVSVAPGADTVFTGESTQLSATPRDSAGSVLSNRVVTWSTSASGVASVNGSGVVTGVGAGAATITATSEGKNGTSVMTVMVVPVASVTVSPATASVAVGATAQLTATPKSAGGATLTGRTVTWASSSTAVATVSGTGVVTGVAVGSATITATSEGKAGTSAVTVTAPPPPPANGVANPTLLPVASGQGPNYGAYNALNVRGLEAGGFYRDPVTNVMVFKVTSDGSPASNQRAVPDYSDGGPFISLPWTSGGKTYYTLYLQVRVSTNDHYLVDFNYTDGTFSNWRPAPTGAGNEITWAFSNNPSTPRIAYYMNARTLHRYDTGVMGQANTGNFPHTFGIGKDGDWLSVDMNDRWFVVQEEFDGGTIAAWNSQTNVEHRAGTGEPHMIRDGSFVMGAEDRASWHEELSGQVVSNTAILNLATGVLTRPDQPESHPAGAANGHFMAVDPNQGGGNQLYRFDPATGTETHLGGRGAIIGSSGHFAGQWVVNNQAGLSMWMLFSGWGSGGVLNNAIAFIPFNATAGNVRLLGHHYSNITDYYAQPHATLSPDGKLVMFGSDMNGSGRIDTFLMRVPTQ